MGPILKTIVAMLIVTLTLPVANGDRKERLDLIKSMSASDNPSERILYSRKSIEVHI